MRPYLYVWFVVIGCLVTLYTITGGSRLGFGLWYLFSPHDERDYILNSLRPHFDGAELWLVMAGGALFFLYPRIFFVVISGFYPVLSIIVILLVFRAIPLLLRNRFSIRHWESVWDVILSVCTFVPMFLLGVIAGYILNGIPLYSQGRFNVNLMGYLSHYTIFSGLLILCAASTLSCTVVAWNSDGIIRINARKWAFYSSILVCVLFADLGIWSLIVSPYISETIRGNAFLYVLPASTFLASLTVPFLLARRQFRLSYGMSVLVIVGLSAILFVNISPHLRTIFFENWTPGVLRPTLPPGSRARALMTYRQKLLPPFIIVMTAVAIVQLVIARRFRRHVHCQLPYDEGDDNLI